MFFRSYRAFRYYGSIFCGNSVLSHFIIRLCSVVPMELNAKMRMEKKTGNLGCFVCPLPVFFSFNYQLFLATLPLFLSVLFYFSQWTICGVGGSRTLVQTRNTHAFYMLILLLIVELSKETDTLNSTLSPKFHYAAGASASLSWNWWAPRSRTGIRKVHPRDVPFIHLVDELSNDLLFFDQAARA